jgi:DNA-binding MarR family transcriptional regulator
VGVEAFAETRPRDRIAAWLNLHQASRVLQTAMEERLGAEIDLSWPEFELLWRLRVSGGRPFQMTEIADQLLASPSGITRIADRLERKGLVDRETPRDNRRVVRVSLTEQGETTLATADRVFFETFGQLFSEPLSDEEVRWLRRILRKLLERSGAWEADRCEPGFEDPRDSQ